MHKVEVGNLQVQLIQLHVSKKLWANLLKTSDHNQTYIIKRKHVLLFMPVLLSIGMCGSKFLQFFSLLLL